MIHSTHSRKELIDLIDIYKLHEGNDYLHNYEDMSKHILARLLWKTIQELHSLSIKDNDLFFFDSLDELKQFVSNPTPNMQIRGKDSYFYTKKSKI